MNIEKRKYKRIPVDLPITVRKVDNSAETESLLATKIRNICGGGVYMEGASLKPGVLVQVSITVPDSTPIHANGIVQYSDENGAGIKFIEIDDDSMGKLEKIVSASL